jgi:hypothetical protein
MLTFGIRDPGDVLAGLILFAVLLLCAWATAPESTRYDSGDVGKAKMIKINIVDRTVDWPDIRSAGIGLNDYADLTAMSG